MRDMNISTGYPDVEQVRQVDSDHLHTCEHSVQFYGDDGFLLDELSRFIGDSLEKGEPAIIVATEAHREGLSRLLQARDIDLVQAIVEGRYIALDASETLSKFMRGPLPDETLFFETIGGVIASAKSASRSERPRIAIFGEMVALLWEEGKPEAAVSLEQLWNELARTHTFELRCGYPMSFFSQSGDSGAFEQICSTHSSVVPTERYTALEKEDDRLREISLLQQKAQALEAEIAERKRIEQALLDSNRNLREALSARDEFLSVAAHELKTPITSLRGFTQLLLRDARGNKAISPERVELALSAIETQTGKLTQLVARLLDTAQIEAGKLRIESARTEMVALIRSALAQQSDTSHRFVYCGPESLEGVVDPVRFEQVLSNLLDNAIKFSPQGGTIAVELTRHAGGDIRLCIADEGVGIPFGERDEVFERFHQAHSDRHLSGMGLGLYITREIVTLHGGIVEIEEAQPRGTRVVVTLPASISAS